MWHLSLGHFGEPDLAPTQLCLCSEMIETLKKYWPLWLLLAVVTLAILIRKKIGGSPWNWQWPLVGLITSPYGYRSHPITGQWKMHNGIDIDGNTGDPVMAAAKGTVVDTWENATGGKQVKIQHPNGYFSGYAHLNEIKVSVGQSVTRDTVIGTVGSTGAVTGSHLHFSMKTPLGEYVDPATFLPPSMT